MPSAIAHPQATDLPIDPFAPDTLETPHSLWRHLRDHEPVAHVPAAGYHVLSRYDDVRRAALATEALSSNLLMALLATGATSAPALVDLAALEGPRPVDVLATADPPAHTRQRRLIGAAFSHRRVSTLEPTVRLLAEDLVAAVPTTGRWNPLAALAVPLPVRIITDLLGFDDGDPAALTRWSEAGVALLAGTLEPDELLAAAHEILAFQAYLADVLERAAGEDRDDVLGDLVRATAEGDERLTRDEALSALLQLFTAGNESTTSLIASALRLLAEDTALQATLRATPARIPAFVEEALRLESPFQGHFRVVREPFEVAGRHLVPGDRLMLLWGAANRDERAFPDADRVDLDRPATPPHLAFGHGIHHCIGATLARLEARVALEVVLARLPPFRLAAGTTPRHVPSAFVRRLATLELEATGPRTS